MNHGYIKSSPLFFRMIKRSFALFVLFLLAMAILIPAPLQEQADISRVPNPVKSAWFLLWIQELVSYSKFMIDLVICLALFFMLLPWISRLAPAEGAMWFPRDQRVVNVFAVFIYLAIVVLTVVAMFFRGLNWSFVYPF